MKTHFQNILIIICTLTVILGLQSNGIFAASPVTKNPVQRTSFCITCFTNDAALQLSPVAPREATFNDEAPAPMQNLAPVTPSEASFEDAPEPIESIDPLLLAPVTPLLPYFEETNEQSALFMPDRLEPATPKEADFNE